MGEIKKYRLINNSRGNILIFSLAFLFFYYTFALLTTEGNSNPLVSSLFDMIIIIAILMTIFHKGEIREI